MLDLNPQSVRDACWDDSIEIVEIDGHTVPDYMARTLINYGVAHGHRRLGDIPKGVVDSVLDPYDGTYRKYEDDETRLVSTRKVSRVLSELTDLTVEEIEAVVNEL